MNQILLHSYTYWVAHGLKPALGAVSIQLNVYN
jgi:hypothetical protein